MTAHDAEAPALQLLDRRDLFPEIERRCVTDVAFRFLSANAAPDYRSMARFRRRHLGALDDLFTQVLVLCATAGLLKLGRVALDGTKLRPRRAGTSHEL